jgi:hypothetical protein
LHALDAASSLATTKYLRTVEEQMRDAVENLGGDFEGDSMTAKGPGLPDLVEEWGS